LTLRFVSRDCVAQFEWDLVEVDPVAIWELIGIYARPSDWRCQSLQFECHRFNSSDCNDKQPDSAIASIRVSFDPDSNANDESESHPQKHCSPRNSTDTGTQIDFNDE
jgi:hypothetical protein